MVITRSAFAVRLGGVLLIAAAAVNAQPLPQRIISTAPSITETLFALGLGDRVVGVTQYCKFPKEVEKIPRIGSWTSTNLEVVLAARPDLIVVQRTAVHDSSRYRSAGLKTLEVRFDTVEDILNSVDVIGSAAGVSDRARALRASIQKQLNEVRNRVASLPRTKVLFVVGRTPGRLEGIIAVSGTSYLSEVIDIAGGQNIFADSKLGFARVIQEEILARDPEVIIDMGEHADASGVTEAQRNAEVSLWRKFGSIDAVRKGRVHIVASEVFVVPGPRVITLARELAKLLHPELDR
jgi:iron complex transport system substrate-binding protein